MNRTEEYRLRGFRLSEPLDKTMLQGVGASEDMSRGQILELIKEYLTRRGKRCGLCGKTFNRRELVIDHRTPANRGGTDRLENLHLLCVKCLDLKGGKTMLEARKSQRLRPAPSHGTPSARRRGRP